MPVNRNIVVMREGNKILLPTIHRRAVDVPPNFPAKTFTMCRVIEYDLNSGTISLKLFSDQVGHGAFRLSIDENSELLASLNIQKIVLVNYMPRMPMPAAPKFDIKDLEEADQKFKEKIREGEYLEKKINENKAKEIQKEIISVQLPVKDLQFLDAKVSFDLYITPLGQKIAFHIINPFIKRQHDSIKNYFPKVLGINKFTIKAELEHLSRKVLSQNATSLEISRIDASL